jgi:hypothetical protein
VSIENDPDDQLTEVSFPLSQPAPKDVLYLLPDGGLGLRLDREGVVKEICEAGLQAKLQPLLEPLLKEAWPDLKDFANIWQSRMDLDEEFELTEEMVNAGLKEVGANLNARVRHALDWFYRRYLRFPIATNPVTRTTLEAIHSGGTQPTWDSDSHGRPVYKAKQKGYRITISFESMPDGDEVIEALWDLVKELSVETGDVFLILLGALTKLGDPKAETATIRPENITKFREVENRHGSAKKLQEDLKDQVLRIAKLRLTMTWEDKQAGKTIIFGKDAPEPLIHILDWQYGKDGKTWTAFELRPGQALTYFLTENRWIGYYSKALLRLNPREEIMTKKVGAYWLMMGEVSAKGGNNPKAAFSTLLTACGLPLNPKRPDRIVKAVMKAHQRLWEIGVLAKVSDPEPEDRKAGYFQRWLNKVIKVKLNPSLFEVQGAKRYPGVCRVSREPASPPQLCRFP